MSEALAHGISRSTFYHLRDTGTIEQLSRRLYRLADAPPLSEHDLIIAASRVPAGVICLISALSFHGITTQIPHEVYLALAPGRRLPSVDYPPVRIFRMSGKTRTEGIELHERDNTRLRMYSAAKTVADCFKFRNKIGLDVALEALRECWRERRCTMDELGKYARICRVANVMRPYLESLP